MSEKRPEKSLTSNDVIDVPLRLRVVIVARWSSLTLRQSVTSGTASAIASPTWSVRLQTLDLASI